MGLPSFLTLRRDALIARLLMAGFTRVSDDKGRFLFLDFYDSPGGIVPVPLWEPDTMKAAEFEDCLDRGEAVCAIVEMQQMFRFDAKPSLFHVELPAKDPLAYLQDHGWYNQGTIAFDDLGTPIYCPAVPPSKDPGPFRSIPGGVAAFDHTVSTHPSQSDALAPSTWQEAPIVPIPISIVQTGPDTVSFQVDGVTYSVTQGPLLPSKVKMLQVGDDFYARFGRGQEVLPQIWEFFRKLDAEQGRTVARCYGL